MMSGKLIWQIPWLGILLLILPATLRAQGIPDLDFYLGKYPGHIVITESQTQDLSVKLVKNGPPVITTRDYRALFVLSDNAARLSESMDYFSASQKLVEFNAYSLIPEKNAYKRKNITSFTRSTEVRDNVFYDDIYSYKFNFPHVAKGTKLVTESVTETMDPFYPIVFFFGSSSPVNVSEFSISLPENMNIQYRLFGLDTNLVTMNRIREGKNTIYKWTASLPQSYLADDLSPDQRFITPHIIVNIAEYPGKEGPVKVQGSMNDVYAHLYKYIKKVNVSAEGGIQEQADSIIKGLMTAEEKVGRIYRWVQQNIRYVAIEDGNNGQVPRDAALVLHRRYGDCKDKSSLLVALINAIGEKASFGWVGTRELPYRYSDFPAVNNSNHMIACWWKNPQQPIILDGTTLHHGFGQVPAQIQGKECLFEKGPGDFLIYTIPVSKASENVSTDSVFISLNQQLLYGNGIAIYSGEKKSDMIDAFYNADSAKCRQNLQSVKPMFSNKFSYSSCKPGNTQNTEQDFRIDYTFTLPDYITTRNNNIYVNLNLERDIGNTVIKTDRWLPIEIETPYIHRFVSVFNIPEGMEVAELPVDVSYTSPKFQFTQHYKRTGNTILLSTETTIDCQLIEGKDIKQYREMILALNKSYSRTITLSKK